MNDYQKLHALNVGFQMMLEQQSINEDSVNESYYIARNFLKRSLEKSYTNKPHRDKALVFFQKGGTILLKELFVDLKFNESKLSVFNALDRIDSLSIKFCNG